MQITHVEVVPVELDLRVPYPTVEGIEVSRVGAVFVRIETQQGDTAWGCTAVDPAFTDATLEEVTRVCRACAARARDLNPINIEYALAELEGGYTIQQTLDVARMLEGKLEMIEQPTLADDLEALREVTQRSAVPILADESVAGLSSALEIAGQRAAHGINVKLAACGGLHCARQMDAIARAAHLATMVGCVHEPALLAAAGLGLALSSSNVRYSDLDGYTHVVGDPTRAGFYLEEGWLYARDVPGLGCRVAL